MTALLIENDFNLNAKSNVVDINTNSKSSTQIGCAKFEFDSKYIHDYKVNYRGMYMCLSVKIKREKMFEEKDIQLHTSKSSASLSCMRSNGSLILVHSSQEMTITLIDEYTLHIEISNRGTARVGIDYACGRDVTFSKLINVQKFQLSLKDSEIPFVILSE